jgi:hypothetical protein
MGCAMRKFVAGWMSRLGGALITLADRLYSPPELRRYVIDHNDARRESRGWN